MSSSSVHSVEYRNACRRCVREVRGQNIDSERGFRRWALRNHPDKGGDASNFQRVSECVDMVYRDECLDKVRDWERGRLQAGIRSEAMVASIIQAASSCKIDKLTAEAVPWLGRWALGSGRPRNLRSSRGASVRVGHRRVLGIPLRLYTDVEARLTADKVGGHLLSVGPNWTIPSTGGRLSLNVSATSAVREVRFFSPSPATDEPFLRPRTLDVTAKLKLWRRRFTAEVGMLLSGENGAFPTSAGEIRPSGLACSVSVNLLGVSERGGPSVLGFGIGGGPQPAKEGEGSAAEGQAPPPKGAVGSTPRPPQ